MKTDHSAIQQQNPLVFYIRTFLYMILALFIRIVTLLPLAALFLFPKGSPGQYIALLCPVLFVLLLLPLRFSFADALVQSSGKRRFLIDEALGLRRHGEKLGEGLLHILHVLLWALPLLAVLGYAYYLFVLSGMDAFSILGVFSSLGETVSSIYCGMINFFRWVFGNPEVLVHQEYLWTGILFLLAVLVICLLLLMLGILRNSASRYIWAHALHCNRNLRSETRRRLQRRRFLQLLCGLINLALWVPFVYALYASYKDTFSLMLQDSSSLLLSVISSAPMDPSVYANLTLTPVLLAFFLLYLPILPLRRYVTAYFATKHLPFEAVVASTEDASPALEALQEDIAAGSLPDPQE